jgi:hypothetical protein
LHHVPQPTIVLPLSPALMISVALQCPIKYVERMLSVYALLVG